MDDPSALSCGLEDLLSDALNARDHGRDAYEGVFEPLLMSDREGGLEAFRVFRSRADMQAALEAAMPAGEWLASAWWPVVQGNLRTIGQQWWTQAEASVLGAVASPGCGRGVARI